MALNPEDNIPKKSEILSLFKQYPIKFVYIFGSLVQRKKGPLSDIDISIYLNPELTTYQRHRLRLELISHIKDLIPSPEIDLVILNDLNILFADKILRKGICIYNIDPWEKQQFEEYILSRSLDFKTFSRQFDEWQAQALIGTR
jgi:predicted nucleotidyltransferase